jgi:outer membrane protein
LSQTKKKGHVTVWDKKLMAGYLKQRLALLPTSAVMSLLLLSGWNVLAQSAPISANRVWHSSEEQKVEQGARNLADSRFTIDSAKTYTLTELVDLAEEHNPATRLSWERARAQAANLGVTRSELYPTLTAAALSVTTRSQAFFGSRFYGQVGQDFEIALELNYTILDFGGRSGRIAAAKAQVLAANFAFNDTHRNVIYQVQQAYYRLLSAIGQEEAARASLSNAQAVQQAAEARLANGLATLPDVLEARSATAQAEYDLQAIIGAEEIARGDLATAVGALATTLIKIQPLDQIPTPDSIADSVDQAITRALGQRPDLLQQVADIRSAYARVKEARSAYYPAFTVSAAPAVPSLYGLQSPYSWAHTADLVGGVRFNLNWTVFDGGARKNRLAQAQADAHAAEGQANVERNQIADEVWAAYSNLNTAFRQRQAAIALLESANQSYNAALESYNDGLRNLLDVTAAQRTLAQARSADVLSRTQVLTSLADLAFRTGDSIRSNNVRLQP